MNDADAAAASRGALAPVLRLERELEAGMAARTATESLLAAARSEGARLVDDARNRAFDAAAVRHRDALDAAHRETAEIAAAGRSNEAELRSHVDAQRAVTIEAALALVLPAGAEDRT
jgi:hypothetical protein